MVERGRRPREYAPALAATGEGPEDRGPSAGILDVVDRGLMDLVSVYRDAIALATGAGSELVNEEIRRDVERLAGSTTPEQNLRRIEAIFDGPRADAGVQRAGRCWRWSR